jgi:hypothetical protein
MEKLVTQQSGDLTRYLIRYRDEQGRLAHGRGMVQRMDVVMDHVDALNKYVNSAPKHANRGGWHYAGSIPVTILYKWLDDNHLTMGQFARNEDGCKDRFKKWFFSRDFAKLHTRHTSTKLSLK